MAEEQIPNSGEIRSISEFMHQVEEVYEIDVPIDLPTNHPLFDIWEKLIEVTQDTPLPDIDIWRKSVEMAQGILPNARYTAQGNITDEFPFNFAQSSELKPVMNLRIDVFKPVPDFPSFHGVKATVFHVPNSREVIVRYTKDVPPEAHFALSPNPTDSP